MSADYIRNLKIDKEQNRVVEWILKCTGEMWWKMKIKKQE